VPEEDGRTVAPEEVPHACGSALRFMGRDSDVLYDEIERQLKERGVVCHKDEQSEK